MLTGSLVELVTPLLDAGEPDYTSLESLVDWHAAEGSAALIVGSAASGAAHLHPDTRAELLRRAVWQSEGRLAIVADIDTPDAVAAIDIAAMAADVGAAAVMLTLPPGGGLTQAAMLRHVERIAEDAVLPLYVRNRFDRPTPPDAAGVLCLARIHGVAGFVECSADPTRARELLDAARPAQFRLFAGLDETACRRVLEGFDGAVSVTANVAPGPIRQMVAAARAGEVAQAESIDLTLRPLHQMLLGDAGGSTVRRALQELGRLPEDPRIVSLPQRGDYSHLRRAMRAAQIIG